MQVIYGTTIHNWYILAANLPGFLVGLAYTFSTQPLATPKVCHLLSSNDSEVAMLELYAAWPDVVSHCSYVLHSSHKVSRRHAHHFCSSCLVSPGFVQLSQDPAARWHCNSSLRHKHAMKHL